jgi:hypothetical protein
MRPFVLVTERPLHASPGQPSLAEAAPADKPAQPAISLDIIVSPITCNLRLSIYSYTTRPV